MTVSYPIAGDNLIEMVSYIEPNQEVSNSRLWINKTQYFENIPFEVWSFCMGKYCISQKWLDDRKGQQLTSDDLTHYQRILSVVTEMIDLLAEIDSVIKTHSDRPNQNVVQEVGN